MATHNITSPIQEPEWHSKPAWKMPGWFEPLLVASILFGAMFFTRRRNYSIFGRRKTLYNSTLDIDSDSARSSDELIPYDPENEDDAQDPIAAAKQLPKTRRCCGAYIQTPNTSQFKDRTFSRILQKFPFLIEMFYWIINYAFYRMTSISSQALFGDSNIWDVAQEHGIAVLEAEQFSLVSFLFPIREQNVQQWFMNGHQDMLTVLNRVYGLVHIPGTVGFIAWYYYIAPSHPTFATVRRTMTLTNFLAFITFVVYPCMPPRLLPKEYGFVDSVRHDDAQSVWQSGKYVNQLAAMPSMHFGYSFCIGMTLIWHSTVFRPQSTLERNERRKNKFWKLFFLVLGVGYPSLILTTIVGTANHYFMDAGVATCFVVLSFLCNKVFFVFIPLEDWFLWLIRAEKPIPSTGERFRSLGGRL